MELNDLIYKILKDYKPATLKPFKDNPIAGLLRNGLNNINGVSDLLPENLIAKGSPGEGQWATVPWISILDKDISTSAQRGIYLVYLFSADSKDVYLSLNQGWTAFKRKYKTKEGRIQITKKASKLRGSIRYTNDRITDSPIDLKSNQDNPKGYEMGNILSIKYSRNDLPNNEQFMDDLFDMIQIFSNLKNNLNFKDEGAYYSLNSNYDQFIKQERDITHRSNNISNIRYEQTTPPNIIDKQYNHDPKPQKRNYEQEHKIKNITGDYGEKIVVKIEKDRLNKLGRNDLANKVNQVSKSIGDGLGYDVLSFNEDGSKIFIEVKSTVGSKQTAFNISRNELRESETKDKHFKLYRLYNINSHKVGFYVLSGNLNKILNLHPISYTATPK